MTRRWNLDGLYHAAQGRKEAATGRRGRRHDTPPTGVLVPDNRPPEDEVLKARAICRFLERDFWENVGRQFAERYPDDRQKRRRRAPPQRQDMEGR